MSEGKEVQRTCLRCGKHFTVLRQGRESLPRLCPRCLDAQQREMAARAAMRLTPVQQRQQWPRGWPKSGHYHEVQVKPATQRFAPKAQRVGWVWWNSDAAVYRGIVQQVPEGARRLRYPAQGYPVLHDVTATTLPELIAQMSRYANVTEQVQRALVRDTPASLRDRMQAVPPPGP